MEKFLSRFRGFFTPNNYDTIKGVGCGKAAWAGRVAVVSCSEMWLMRQQQSLELVTAGTPAKLRQTVEGAG